MMNYLISRQVSFCAHAIQSKDEDIFVVPETHKDERFVNNGLVTGPPFIRFYAGQLDLRFIHSLSRTEACDFFLCSLVLHLSQRISLSYYRCSTQITRGIQTWHILHYRHKA